MQSAESIAADGATHATTLRLSVAWKLVPLRSSRSGLLSRFGGNTTTDGDACSGDH
jgi:hypothetical protein